METQIIRDFYGRIIAYIDTDNKGNKTVRDWQKVILGTYNKTLNLTRTFDGKIIARGDVCSSLIPYNK